MKKKTKQPAKNGLDMLGAMLPGIQITLVDFESGKVEQSNEQTDDEPKENKDNK